MSAPNTFVVWMHKCGKVSAVAHFATRELADAYASCSNRRSVSWFEVRRYV